MICQEMICGKGMSLVVDEKPVDRERWRSMAEKNFRGQRLQLETNDERRLMTE